MQKLNAMLTPLITLILLCVTLTGFLAACDGPRERSQAVDKAHVDARNRCSAKWYGQPRAPVRGSDYVLDATRLPWEMGGDLWYEDADCGVAQMNAVFYWTGKEILPQRIGMFPQPGYNVKPIDVPQSWTPILVTAVLGIESSSIRDRAQHPENYQYTLPQRPKSWPPEQLVKLKHYQDLEVRTFTPLRPTDSTNVLDFMLREWPRDDGSPRMMGCNVGKNIFKMTREEIENLDFNKRQNSSCQLEFNDFRFNGGSARVNFGTDQLHQITPALRALHQYFNASITKEKS